MGADESAVRTVHERWFVAAAAKDLEASMRQISPTIVSYEHSGGLQVTDLDGVRGQCAQGFALAPDDLTWTVPDLQVHVGGDLAVAWGLNRMSSHHPDGTAEVTWSRGTRVFRRSGDSWIVVHQHVSFPVDDTTGAAATGLTP